MQQERVLIYPSNAFGRFWMRLPLILRSIILGIGVSSIGIGVWVALFSKLSPPWSVSAMGLILVIYSMYFSGKWNPINTKEYRRFCFRRTRMDRTIWFWGIIAAFFIVVTLQFGWQLTFRIYEFQPEVFKVASSLNNYPSWMAWSMVLMASLVAGICEEVGYRGYLQAPLEKKYGPVIGISVTSVVFVLVHLHQAWVGGISGMIGIFIISGMIGYLAFATRSLIPGIMAHVSFDIINFSYWWSDVLGSFDRKPIGMTGVDGHFIAVLSVVVLSMVLFILVIRKLLRLRGETV